jgi:hypothetical protein
MTVILPLLLRIVTHQDQEERNNNLKNVEEDIHPLINQSRMIKLTIEKGNIIL